MPKIYETTEYDQFAFFSRNRVPANKKLIESIKEKNNLANCPIICTKVEGSQKLWVIDGQNRLKAAQKLNVPIYYIVDEKLQEDDIARLNYNQEGWDIKDFHTFYKNHNDYYKFVEKIHQLYNLSIVTILSCLNDNGRVYDNFRSGNFTIKKNLDQLEQNFEYLNEIIEFYKRLSKDKRVFNKQIKAIWMLINSENYSHKEMIKKINTFPDNFIECFLFNEARNVLSKLLNSVYNYRTAATNKLKIAME